MPYEFRLPDIGEGLHEAEILKWFVQLGEVIQADQPVVEVQTDKAAVEIASPVGGTVVQLGGEVGQIVKVGEVLIAVATNQATATSVATAPTGTALHANTQFSAQTETPLHLGSNPILASDSARKRPLAAPAVRKLARELGVDLRQVLPSDPRGHVTSADVQQYAKAVRNAGTRKMDYVDGQVATDEDRVAGGVPQAGGGVEAAEPAKTQKVLQAAEAAEAVERHPIRGLRKKIYENMTRSMYTAPQVTGMDELDMSRLVEVRKRMLPFAEAKSIRLTYLPFIIKAVTHVLKENPIFNASVDDEKMEIVYKKHIHIGIATATPEGLLVPVIRHADGKSVFQIAAELEDLSRRGRERKLKLSEVSGSTFTISSTGVNGGWFATPMLNYPEVAILGVHSIAKKPVVLPDDSIVARHVMGFSLTFDHRVIDGEPAGLFMHGFKQILENPELLMVL